jgi:hypothetical protein
MCKICNKTFKNNNSLSKHLRLVHDLSLVEYHVKYEDFNIPKCPYCGDECTIRCGLVFHKTCCKKDCLSVEVKNRKHSKETKKIISEKRKIWLKENPEKHPWKNNKKFLSKPCEKVKKDLIKYNISFEEELQPLKDRFYSIDIAIVDKGIGLEINGNQHYNNDKTLKDYYQKRKELIEEKGWKLYDIHYTKVYDDNFIKELVKKIKGEEIVLDLDFKIKEKVENGKILKDNKTKICACGKRIHYLSKRCVVCEKINRRKVERPDKETLLKEIKELGYTGTGRKYGVSDNAIRKWIKCLCDVTE